MKAIQEIIRLLQEFGFSSMKDFSFPFKNHSQTYDFFQFLKEGSIQDDDTASFLFFDKQPDALPYQRTKRTLLQQLIKALFLIEPKKLGKTPYQRAYYHCWNNLCAAKILLGRSAHQAALRVIKSILNRTVRFEFTLLSMECYKLLRWYYACMDGNAALYQKYHGLYQKEKKILEAEQLAEDYYTHISSTYLTDKSQRFFLARLAKKYWAEVYQLMKEHSSQRLHFLGHLLHVYSFACAGDYEGALIADQEAIGHFEKKKNGMDQPVITFMNHQLACCIKLKKNIQGQQVAARLQKAIRRDSFDWFVHRNLIFLFWMHTGRYREARTVVVETVRQPAFKKLPRGQVEKWRINHAYVYFLEKTGHLEPITAQKQVFPMKDFLRSVPLFSKDKRGMNVPVLIIQMLIYISEKNYDAFIDRIDAIKKYSGRYLRMQDAYRSSCFIKMLVTISKNNFHPQAIARQALPLKEKLAKTPLDVSPQAYELEIIPYELLWDLIMKALSKNQ